MADWKLDREGRKALADKYCLSPKQFRKLTPPSLEGTRLYCIGDLKFGRLSERLLKVHRSCYCISDPSVLTCFLGDHRSMIKVALCQYKVLAMVQGGFARWTPQVLHGLGQCPSARIRCPCLKSFLEVETDDYASETREILEQVDMDPQVVTNKLFALRRW